MNEDKYYVVPGETISQQAVKGQPAVKIIGEAKALELFRSKPGEIVFSEEQNKYFAVTDKGVGVFTTSKDARKFIEKRYNYQVPIAYCDGSYDPTTMKIGAGLVMLYGERSTKTNKKLEKSWQIPYSDLKNISGELEASLEAAKTAYMEGLDEITIYHDFEGVSNITCYNGDSSEISSYVEKMKDISSSLKINFVKVKSHSGDVLNNRADELAREAIGL